MSATLESRVTVLEEGQKAIQDGLTEIKTQLRTMQPGKFSLANFGVICACVVALGGLGAAYVTQATRPLAEAAQVSIKDRDALHALVLVNADKLATGEVRDAATQKSLVEIETQIKGIYDIVNIQHAENLRIVGLLWEKVYSQPYPTTSFFPQPRSLPQ